MATKDVNALLTYFLKVYKQRYGVAPSNFNRYAKKWGFSDMLSDLGFDRSRELIDYFFESSGPHTAEVLLREYGDYNESFEAAIKDKQKRSELALETKRRVQAYRAAKQSRTTGNQQSL